MILFEKLTCRSYMFYYTFMSFRFFFSQLHFTSTWKKGRQRSRLKIKAISKVREKRSLKIFSRKYFLDIHVPQQYRIFFSLSDPSLHNDITVSVWRGIWAFPTRFHQCLTSRTLKSGPLKPPAVLHIFSAKYHAQRFKTAPNTTLPDYYRVNRVPQLECKYIYHCLLASASQVKPAGTRPLARPLSLLPFPFPSRPRFPVIVLCVALGKGSLYRNLKKVKWPGRKLVLSAREHY